MYNANIQQNTTLSATIVIKNSISDVGRESISDFLYSQSSHQNTMTTLETCNHSKISIRKFRFDWNAVSIFASKSYLAIFIKLGDFLGNTDYLQYSSISSFRVTARCRKWHTLQGHFEGF